MWRVRIKLRALNGAYKQVSLKHRDLDYILSTIKGWGIRGGLIDKI